MAQRWLINGVQQKRSRQTWREPEQNSAPQIVGVGLLDNLHHSETN
jgi:hypothetical protein